MVGGGRLRARRGRKGLTDMTPDPPAPSAVGAKVHAVFKAGGRSYVANSTVTQVGAYRFEGSGTLGKLAGSRTVVAGESPSEAVFTYEIEITPSGMNRLLRPSSLAPRAGGSGEIWSVFVSFSRSASSS